jgi:uncharacterized protein (DUF305 family)
MRRPVLLAVLTALALAGCVAPPADPAPPAPVPLSTGFNDTDVMYLQMMVPHHHQGIAIVRLAAERADRPEVITLAAAIESTQASEVEEMAQWLQSWSQPATADPAAHAAHGGMPGTSEAEISQLRGVTGAEFERAFLNTMIAHQDDAVQLARMEVAGGVNTLARDFAQRIDQSRTAQISQMLALLDTTPA